MHKGFCLLTHVISQVKMGHIGYNIIVPKFFPSVISSASASSKIVILTITKGHIA